MDEEIDTMTSNLRQGNRPQTAFEINLAALKFNYHAYRKLLNRETKIMAMVKAFSYGTGVGEIGKTLENEGADYFGVAYVHEGVSLRNSGVTAPIIVMSPEPGSYKAMLEHNLEPEIFTLTEFDDFAQAIDGLQGQFAIHIKLETGMNRQGLVVADLPDLIKKIKQHLNITVATVFSHLAASDNPAEDAFTEKQIIRFEQMSNRFVDAFDYPIQRHILNSAGITRFPHGQFDMVRLGIGLYGFDPSGMQDLQVVGKLKTRISQIKNVRKGETVGYDRSAKMSRDSKIAILPIGYVDGLLRALSNGVGKVWISGKLAPIVGKVCMDLCMVDVTDVDANEGDEVEIFGENITLQQLAGWMGTIPYEVLTTISQRVKRVYKNG